MEDEQINEVATLVNHKLAVLPYSTVKPSIYKIPRHLFEVNEKAYLPSVVSIGPIHSQEPYLQLQSTQELKSAVLQCFLQVTSGHYGLEDYIRFLRDNEEKAHSYYAERVSLSSNDFIMMLLIDAVFVINYLMLSHEEVRRYFPGYNLIRNQIEIAVQINWDILLEDNQLPFLFYKRFTTWHLERVKQETNIEHLVDFLWICFIPSKPREKAEYSRLCSSVSYLHAAGVKFEATENRNMLDISFNEGVLRIPKIKIQDSTESIFHSILIFEQCHHNFYTHFADYMIFLDSLINTPEDVGILVRSGIIDNWLSSDYAVADFFNNITKNITMDSQYFYYAGITNRLNAHASARLNQWKAILKRDYFSHPWVVIFVIYAVVLLILTLLQTVGTFTQQSN